MSRDISGSKQATKFVNTRNRGRVRYSLKTRQRFTSHAKCIVRIATNFASLLLAVRPFTVSRYYLQKSDNDHWNPSFANITS